MRCGSCGQQKKVYGGGEAINNGRNKQNYLRAALSYNIVSIYLTPSHEFLTDKLPHMPV